MRALIVAAALCGLLLVVFGASTGHSPAPPPAGSDLYVAFWVEQIGWQDLLNTILLFGFVHVLAALGVTALQLRRSLALASGWTFLAGAMLFSGGLAVRMLLGKDHAMANALTMLVPVGGIAFMLGWLLLIAAALLKGREN